MDEFEEFATPDSDDIEEAQADTVDELQPYMDALAEDEATDEEIAAGILVFILLLAATGSYQLRGRTVPDETVTDALEHQIEAARANIRSLGIQYATNELSLDQWRIAMRRQMKVVHTHAGAIAKGGWGQMSPADWRRVGRISAPEYEALDKFVGELRNKTVRLKRLDGQVNGNFLRRADLHGQAGITTKTEMQRAAALQNIGDALVERRRLDSRAQHCACCPAQAALGWQPPGVLLPIGNCDCSKHCRCDFEYGRRLEDGTIERL